MTAAKIHDSNYFSLGNVVSGLDFDPSGDSIATTDGYGNCLISNVDTNHCTFHLKLTESSYWGNLTY